MKGYAEMPVRRDQALARDFANRSPGVGRDAAVSKISGRGRYPPDEQPSGTLQAAVLRSLEPHATIQQVDAAAALRIPGVRAIVTRADLGRDQRVRHYGDFVAAVAADSLERAQEAVGVIDVELLPLPTSFDPLCATEAELYAEHRDNVTLTVDRVIGSPDTALAAADVRLEQVYRTGRPTHSNLCRRCCLARELPDGTLEVHTAVNAPFFARQELAGELGIPADRIRIVLPQLMPSSFGGRSGISHLCEPVAAALARRTGGRPVRLYYEPEEEFVAGHTRHPVVARITGGATASGDLTVLDIDLVADHAGHANFVARIVLANCRDRALDLWRPEHYRFRGRAVVTNNVPAGEMRGIGSTQIMFLLGSFLDELARRVGMDPLEFHLRNSVHPGHRIPDSGKVLARVGLQECLKAGAEAIGWPEPADDPPGAQAPPGRYRRGLGVGIGTHTTGLGTFHGPDTSRAVVAITADGNAVLRIAAPDSGQGSSGVYAQIAARELGVSYDRIWLAPIDTDLSPHDPWGSVASRGVYVVGAAVGVAARQARDRLIAGAASLLGTEAARLTVCDGRVVMTDGDGPSVSIDQVVAATGAIEEEATSPMDDNPPTYGACFVEVEVDTDTGDVHVTRAVAALDVGAVLSPQSCRSQIEGALAQGIEYALGSELVMDNGMPANASLVDYRLFQPKDLPDIQVIMIETPETSGPYGARGVGTPAIVPVAPAVCNAIRSAVGVRVTEIPVRPETLWSMMRSQSPEPYSGPQPGG